jgi:hypothetical protein
MSECPGVPYWKILSVVQIRTGGPQCPHRFVVMLARGCLWLTLVPAEAAPSPLGGDSERKITHVTSAWQWRTGASALRLVLVALWKTPSLNQREKGGLGDRFITTRFHRTLRCVFTEGYTTHA